MRNQVNIQQGNMNSRAENVLTIRLGRALGVFSGRVSTGESGCRCLKMSALIPRVLFDFDSKGVWSVGADEASSMSAVVLSS